jgi:integrase
MGRRTTGTLYLRESGIYWLEYYCNGVRVRESMGTKNRKLAEKRRQEIIAPIQHGSRADKVRAIAMRVSGIEARQEEVAAKKNRIPLAKLWGRFPYRYATRGAVRRELKPSVVAKTKSLWNAFLGWLEETGRKRDFANEVTPADAEAYSQHCRDSGLGARGHNCRIQACRTMLTLAKVTPNPFANIKKWMETNEHRDSLEIEDLDRILATAQGELRLLIVIGIFTGLRLGDAATLCWSDIRQGRIFKSTAKTGKEVSFILLPQLADELARVSRLVGDRGHILSEIAAKYKKSPQSVSMAVRRLFESCHIEVIEKAMPGRARAVSRRGFHCLRTTFVSLCARSGIPVGAIAAWCGHSPEVNRVYQRWAGKTTDALFLRALAGVKTIPSVNSQHVIDVDGKEVPDVETIIVAIGTADGKTLMQVSKVLGLS